MKRVVAKNLVPPIAQVAGERSMLVIRVCYKNGDVCPSYLKGSALLAYPLNKYKKTSTNMKIKIVNNSLAEKVSNQSHIRFEICVLVCFTFTV